MKDHTIGVTFQYAQNYLPTKRHKIEETRKMVIVRNIVVHEIDEKDFPVAIKVTDFDILPHNWEDSRESKYDTIECRWDGKNLYKEKRSQSGSDKGELIFSSADAFIESVRHHSRTEARDYYVAPGKEYQDGKSIDTENDLDSRVTDVQEYADYYVICNNKVWVRCGQPYYNVMTFGLGGNHGGTGFFIGWTDEESISRYDFLATQRALALKDFVDTAEGRGDDHDLDSYRENGISKNIKVLIPEAYTLKRNLESEDYKGYIWSDEMQCYVKEYGKKGALAYNDTFHICIRHGYGDRLLAIVHVDNFSFINVEVIWRAIGQVFEDIRNVSFADISEIYSLGNDMDLLKWLNER